MDNHVENTQTTLQSTCGSNYYPTKSCDNTGRSKSSDKQSTFNSHSIYTEDTKCSETATSFQIESKPEIIRTLSTEKLHNKRIREMRKRHTLPAKTVFLKWWLDTSGCSKPLRSAWEDEEECMYRSAASSHRCSPTYFDGPGVSFTQSANEAYMFVSTCDPHLRNSVSEVSRLINLFPRTHKKHKTNTKSLRSHMESPLSLNESVNQKVSLSQHFLHKDDTVYERKCAESYQNQENQQKVNDMRCWLSAASRATRDVHDRNTSSNVVLPAHVSSASTSGAGNQNHIDNVKTGQKEGSKNTAALPHVQEVSNQQTSTPDINKINEVKYKQNSENNSRLRGNISNGSQSGNQQFSSNVRKDIKESKSGHVNELECEELPVSDDPINIQTFVIPDKHPFTRDTEVSDGRPHESKHEEPEYNQLLNEDAEGAIATTNCDQDYNSFVIKTGPDDYNAGNVGSFLAEEADKSPPKSSDSIDKMKADCFSSNIYEPKSLSPNFYVRFGNRTHTELGRHRQLLSSQTNMINNDDDDICTRSRGSYFSRLAEKRIGLRESQKNRQDASKAGKLLLNKHANTEDQSAPVSANFTSSKQSNEQSKLPLAILRETLWNSGLNSHLVIHKHTLSDDPRNKKIKTPSDGSNPLKQYLPQNSEILPFDEDNNFSNDNAGHINGSITETDLENCSSHGVSSEYPQTNDCRLNSGEDAEMESSTDKLIRNHDYAKFESEDENSSLDDNEQNSVSSNAYSSEKSASVASRNSWSDLDESVSDYVKWSATSWSNTSLPPQHYFESEVSQMKYSASSTKIDEKQQKQIIRSAKLLVLLLDKLPMKECAWNDCLHENNRTIKDSVFKRAYGFQGRSTARSVSFHSHILSLLSKHFSFNKIKPLITGNEESVPQQTLERNGTTYNSKLKKCKQANLILKDKLVYANRELYTNKANSRLSFIHSLQKPKFQDASYGLTKYVSKMSEQGCIKHNNKQKKNMCNFHQMFPKRKSTFGSQEVFCDRSPLGSFKNMQFQPPDSENQPTSQSCNKISYRRQEKQKRNRHKTDVNNSENIMNESYTKYGPFRVSKRINRERSRRLSDIQSLNAKPDYRKQNMAAGEVFISKTSMLRGHKPHPPDASQEESQVKITLLYPPGLTPREPVYPKPKPYALGQKQDHKATSSEQTCDLPVSSATQLSLGRLKRSFTTNIPWTKPHLKSKLQASEIRDISTPVSVSSETVETTETRLLMKNNKEVCNSKTQKNVLPPLCCITSENIDTSSDKISTNNSKIPKCGLLVDQHKTAAPGQDNCQIKQDLSSLVPLDTMPKPQYDSKSVSPENSRRIHRQTILTSLQNHGQLLSPLRHRFDCIKNKASNCVLKAPHSPSLRVSCAPHYLCANQARDNHDVEQITTASPGVSVTNVDTNDLQSLMAQNRTDEGNSCDSLEMHNFNLFVNKKNITSQKTEKCENSSAVERVQNMHDNNYKSPDTRISEESKVINNRDHDKKTSDITQENNNSDTTNKKPNTLVPKSKCPSTSTFKFLTLLLSDELDSSQI